MGRGRIFCYEVGITEIFLRQENITLLYLKATLLLLNTTHISENNMAVYFLMPLYMSDKFKSTLEYFYV